MEINEVQGKLLNVLGGIGNDLFKAISEFLLKEKKVSDLFIIPLPTVFICEIYLIL